MSQEPAEVSVIIPCYNQGRFLCQAIDSILEQKPLHPGDAPPRIEIIVVNDGSIDNTREAAAPFLNRITYLEQKNAGVSAARNHGVLESRGPFLHFLDADDWIAPDFYALMLAAAAQSPDVGLFHGSCLLCDEDRTPGWLRKAEPLPENDLLHKWLTACQIASHTAFIRRAAFARTAGFNPAVVCAQDWDLWIRLAASAVRYQAVPDAVAMYRRYSSSVSRDFEQLLQYGNRMLRSHAGHHGNCKACRRAVKQGLRHHYKYALQTAYWHSFGRHRRTHGLAAAVRFLARTCAGHPSLVFEIMRHMRERWGPGAKGTSPPAAPVPAASTTGARA